jgi:hypothetical protein
MKLITYMDEGKLRTLMVTEFRDRYNTADGYVVKYAVGGLTIEILAADIVAEHTLREPLHNVSYPGWQERQVEPST